MDRVRFANGFANFVKTRYVISTSTTIPISPALNELIRLCVGGGVSWVRWVLGSCGPVVGLRLNVSPFGTRARPLNVGP